MIKFNNSKQITIKKQQILGSHEEQALLNSLVHLILCWAGENRKAMTKNKICLVLLVSLLRIITIACAEEAEFANILLKNKLKGTILISSLDGKMKYSFNDARSQMRFVPASTFKILNTLIALEEGAISNEKETIKWDGNDKGIPAWNKDQTIETAFSCSCVWFYQELARRIGGDKYKRYLRRVGYGNQSFGPEIDTFWLNGNLKISAAEQLAFLKRVYSRVFEFKSSSYDILRKIMTLEQTHEYIIRGKTGWSNQIGWFVGYVESNENTWFFAINLDIKTMKDCHFRQEVAFEALRAKGIIK